MGKPKKKTEPQTEFRVLMFGPRRCGKTSALSAMIDQFETVSKAADDDIVLTADSSTTELLAGKKTSLMDIFEEHSRKGERWEIDENPDSAMHEYVFTLQVRGSANRYPIIFTDIPGEWLMEKERKKEVDGLLEKSQAVLVAVDTPHLVEDGGAYSRSFNIMDQVENFLMNIKGDSKQARLLLFVPLKCEKYYHEGRMDVVNAAIKEQYGKLLTSLQSSDVKKAAYTVAITPILTLGGVVFQDFGRDEEGFVDRITTMLSRSLFKRPKHAYYKLYEADPCYKPKYCEQPVLYLLNYVLRIAEVSDKAKKKKGGGLFKAAIWLMMVLLFWPLIFVGGAWEMIHLLKKDTSFLSGVGKTCGYLKTSGDGYELLQDPLRLGGNAG